MTSSLFGPKEPVPSDVGAPLNQAEVAERLRQEAAVYVEIGEFFFGNDLGVSSEMLLAWFEDVALSSPERRWATLEMLAMYGLSAAEVTDGFPLTEQQQAELVASVAPVGPLQAELEYAAMDVLALLQSGTDPVEELPAEWSIYREAIPEAFVAACLVFAVLTLETVREVAAQDHADPAVVWRDWLTGAAGR